ncbi:hypothetical protein BHM03_00027427, partial [Ensete ventricosum]
DLMDRILALVLDEQGIPIFGISGSFIILNLEKYQLFWVTMGHLLHPVKFLSSGIAADRSVLIKSF